MSPTPLTILWAVTCEVCGQREEISAATSAALYEALPGWRLDHGSITSFRAQNRCPEHADTDPSGGEWIAECDTCGWEEFYESKQDAHRGERRHECEPLTSVRRVQHPVARPLRAAS